MIPMNLIKLKISSAFVRERRVPLSWPDIRFGLEKELLDPAAAIDFAIDQVAEEDKPSAVLLDLAGAGENDRLEEFVDRLAGDRQAAADDRTREKWLYLVLAWIYQHRDRYADPLQMVEEVYSDFNYPQDVAKFVRYMPMAGPGLGSNQDNEQRLFERWESYLKERAQTYNATPDTASIA